MEDLIKFHKKLWRKELVKGLRNLMTAYIHKHRIFPETKRDRPDSKKYDFKDLAQMGAMMGGMEDDIYLKRLK